jgi:hypothetical protein
MRLVILTTAFALPAPTVLITGTYNATAPPIPNVFSALTAWSPGDFSSAAPPADFSTRYPFLTHIQFFTATGGCYAGFPNCSSDRDLFNDGADPASGVNASRLFAPLRHVLAAGLKPHLVTGNVPIALSSPPLLGGFGVNAALPRDLAQYSAYIEEVARQLRAEFGLAEVRTWRWGVFTEYNNQDWLIASADQFADLFDWTVCGLERALGGAANVDVGVHACTQCFINDPKRHWDALLFLEHAAGGVSACTGGPVHFNWSGNSFYEDAPGRPGDLSWLGPQALPVLARARALGLPSARFGIDEGRLLSGPDGLPLTARAVGDAYQVSWDALMVKLLAAAGAPDTYYSRWGVSTGSLFDAAGGVADNAAANLARLAWALAGARAVATAAAPGAPPPPQGSIVDALAGGGGDGALRALLFHHVPALDAALVPPVLVGARICGCAARGAGPVPGARVTRLDAEHGTFWRAWRADAAAANLSAAAGDYTAGWSELSDSVPVASRRARALLAAGLPRYRSLAALSAEGLDAEAEGGGCVNFQVLVPPHGAALVELPGVL